ncbi:NACHT domain-containing protein [Planosporangium sp. 12N6]|uniref:NACHT domain-containing protein n=1 Tax=Planosporangium spinosum TaxID=3402278 RepID=UPI003CEBBBE4
MTFDVTDLHRILQTTPTVLLLDALDEVADPEDRALVISAVCETLTRFEGNLIIPQVVVTSRPTAIEGSPTFPVESFLHMALAPLDEMLALDYADKWAQARRLDESDRKRLPRTLRDKMRAPHIAQLAKNTMQLSILLSLVQRRGASLPDKRTELYNAYFDIFLDRESEKSAVVRDNRDLLFDIHRFLGFHLHSIAEKERRSGRIRHDRLKWLLRDYLTKEKQPHDLIDSLLAGMVERFGALVSRVQGQYEFEVQPLQEYFAARHLNDTAPPSPTGREKPGTKADRFDGIAPNPYWFNVTRFLAGCFNKGELADLADRLCDLMDDPSQRGRPFARSLAVALLQDWVFSQSPRATRKVVRTVFDEIGLAWAAAGYLDLARSNEGEVLALPPGGGAEHLTEICWDLILKAEQTERTASICRLLAANSPLESLAGKWYTEFQAKPEEERSNWFVIGSWLGVPRGLSYAQCLALASNKEAPWRPLLPSFLIQGRAPIDDLPDAVVGDVFSDWLKYPGMFGKGLTPGGMDSVTYFTAWVTSPQSWLDELRGYGYASAEQLYSRLTSPSKPSTSPTINSIREVGRIFSGLLNQQIHVALAPWVEAVSSIDAAFGRTWTSAELGVIAGAIRNSAERGRGGESLLDNAVPLPVRIRYAKRLSGDPTWWREQRLSATDEYDVGVWCLATALWTKSGCLVQLGDVFDEAINSLSTDMRQVVLSSISSYRRRLIVEPRSGASDNVSLKLSADTLTVIAYRLPRGGDLVPHLLNRMESPFVADLCLEWLVSPQAESIPPKRIVQYFRDAQLAEGDVPYGSDIRGSASRRYEISRLILDDPWEIPTLLVGAATGIVLRKKLKYPPALEVAAREHWFEEEEEDDDDDFDFAINSSRRRR